MTATTMMHRREALRLGVLAGLGAMLPARTAWARNDPANLMPRLTALVERWVGPGKFPGIVAVLGLPGREAQFIARGSEGFTDTDTMTPDSLFRIYSMTKPVTGMAAMMLIDDGKLGLDQPLAEILPKFARMQVQVTPDGSITDLRPAKNPILIRHLLTHTSGLGYSIIQRGPLKAAYEEAGLVPGLVSRIPMPGLERGKAADSLATFADRLATMPLVYEPGATWNYGVGLDLLGRVIEVVSGQTFDAFLKDRLFEPAGMFSTFFQVPASEMRRLTTSHAVVANRLVPIDPGVGSVFADKPPFPFGGAGLVSSPRDYDRFLRMLAQYGVIDGKRVMGELAVRVGTDDLLPEGVNMANMSAMGMAGASGFGAGGRVGKGPEAGTYGWAGAAGTVAAVDMKRGVRSSLFLQFMPPQGLSILSEYQQALREDLAALTTGS